MNDISHRVIVRVRELSIERRSYPVDGAEQVNVTFERLAGGPFESVYFTASLPASAPNPFTIGQSLSLLLEPLPEVPNLPVWSPEEVAARDESLGLGVDLKVNF